MAPNPLDHSYLLDINLTVHAERLEAGRPAMLGRVMEKEFPLSNLEEWCNQITIG